MISSWIELDWVEFLFFLLPEYFFSQFGEKASPLSIFNAFRPRMKQFLFINELFIVITIQKKKFIYELIIYSS